MYKYVENKNKTCTSLVQGDSSFINKERVEKVKMASQQMPSALRLFLDLGVCIACVFSPLQRTLCTNASTVKNKTYTHTR